MNKQRNNFALFLQISSVFMLIANVYIAYKLAPLAQDLAIIQTRVEAIESTYVEHGEIDFRLIDVINRLDRIEAKIDRHIEK